MCDRLGWRFLDLPSAAREPALREALGQERADLIALPWEMMKDRKAMGLARRSGYLMGLWGHPLEMQKRSGRKEQLFTPVKGLKTKGGFGREGTRCTEFRRLDRACGGVLFVTGLALDEAVQALAEVVREISAERSRPLIEQAGLAYFVKIWREDHDADKRGSEMLADAMARYVLQLRSEGASPRRISAIRSDLQAAGHLVFMYDAPKGKQVLREFTGYAPWAGEFRRKFTDSSRLVERYERNLEAFGEFLGSSGLVGKG